MMVGQVIISRGQCTEKIRKHAIIVFISVFVGNSKVGAFIITLSSALKRTLLGLVVEYNIIYFDI